MYHAQPAPLAWPGHPAPGDGAGDLPHRPLPGRHQRGRHRGPAGLSPTTESSISLDRPAAPPAPHSSWRSASAPAQSQSREVRRSGGTGLCCSQAGIAKSIQRSNVPCSPRFALRSSGCHGHQSERGKLYHRNCEIEQCGERLSRGRCISSRSGASGLLSLLETVGERSRRQLGVAAHGNHLGNDGDCDLLGGERSDVQTHGCSHP